MAACRQQNEIAHHDLSAWPSPCGLSAIRRRPESPSERRLTGSRQVSQDPPMAVAGRAFGCIRVPDDGAIEASYWPRGRHMVDPIRRRLLKTGAAAAALAATPSVLAQQSGT